MKMFRTIRHFLCPGRPLEPLVSVIVTSYNYERYISQTLDSLLSQTYSNFEVVIVDDGSTDGSVNLIASYVASHSNVRLLTHERKANKGLIASMRLALANAHGDYVAFCESDDYWSPDHLEQLVACINRHSDAVLISNHIQCFGDEAAVKVRQAYADYVYKRLKSGANRIDLTKNQSQQLIPTFSCVAIRKDVTDRLNFDCPVEAWIDFWLYRQIEKDYPLYYISRKLTFWRQHESLNGEQSQSDFDEKMATFLSASNRLLHIPDEAQKQKR